MAVEHQTIALKRKDGSEWSTPPRQLVAPTNGRRLNVRYGTEITPRQINWLWRPFLQRGALNLITGDPGIGKSTLVCDLIARLTRGDALPEAQPQAPVNCWIMNGEDNADDTIIWRLNNQGAILHRVSITDQSRAIDAAMATEIRDVIKERDIGFVVIDPLQAWMGREVDMNRANETREWAGMLRDVAQETGACIAFVRHRRKGQPGDNNLYAGIGSIDISGFARSEISVLKAQSGVAYLTRTKGNVGGKGDALSYTVEPHGDPANDHGVLRWTGTFNPEGPGAKGNVVPKKLGKAMEWLKDQLADGPKPAQGLFEAAIKAGFAETTLKRAKIRVADSYQELDGASQVWYWSLKQHDGAGLDAEHLAIAPRRG